MSAAPPRLAMMLLAAAFLCACSSKFSPDKVFPAGPARSIAYLAETNSVPDPLPADLSQGLNLVGRYELTPLLWAVKNDNVRPATLAILVRNGADPFYYSKTQLTSPLLHSLNYGPLDEFKALVSSAKQIDQPQAWNPHEPTLLFSAVANRDLAKLQAVVKAGAKLEKTNDLGETPLLYAGTGQLNIMLYLLRAGANARARDSYGHDVCDNVNWLHYNIPERQRELDAVLSELQTKGIACKRKSR